MSPILSQQFKKDVAKCIKASAREFGLKASIRYEKLIATAMADIASDPLRNGSREFEQVRLYHIKHSKERAAVDGVSVKKPRHIIAYKIQDDRVLAVRLLFDRMDFSAHL